MIDTHTDIPNAGIVEEVRTILSHFFDVSDVPHIETVVIVYHTQLQDKMKGTEMLTPRVLLLRPWSLAHLVTPSIFSQ